MASLKNLTKTTSMPVYKMKNKCLKKKQKKYFYGNKIIIIVVNTNNYNTIKTIRPMFIQVGKINE